MSLKVQPMGDYQTNCYIITVDGKDFIIDPGVEQQDGYFKTYKILLPF